jgi:hypothetical protein
VAEPCPGLEVALVDPDELADADGRDGAVPEPPPQRPIGDLTPLANLPWRQISEE